MKKVFSLVLGLLIATTALAKSYECVVNGKPTKDSSGTDVYQLLKSSEVELGGPKEENTEIEFYNDGSFSFGLVPSSAKVTFKDGKVVSSQTVSLMEVQIQNNPVAISDTTVTLGSILDLEDLTRNLLVHCEPIP
jgi:hypothetical protein